MSRESISQRYYKVLEDLDLDDIPMSDWDLLDLVTVVANLEHAFNISIDDEKVDELFFEQSHENWITYIESLL